MIVAPLGMCDELTLCVPCGSDIAIALHTPPHRAVSLALVAQALGASQGKGRLSRSFTALSKSAFNLSESSFGLPKGRASSRKREASAKMRKAAEVQRSSAQDDV